MFSPKLVLSKTQDMKVVKSEGITAFGGTNFVFEYLNNKNIGDLLEENLPLLPKQSIYSWKDMAYSLLSVYLCGGDCTEDLQTHLKSHFHNNPFFKLTSPDTIQRRMSELSEDLSYCTTLRSGKEHAYSTNAAMAKMNVSLLKHMGILGKPGFTLDFDHSIIFNEKRDSSMTYKRQYGYQPAVCTVNEDQVLYIENRNGNSSAAAFQLDTIERIFSLLEENNAGRPAHFRADAASYQYEVIDLLDRKVENFYIGCRNSYVDKYFATVTEWHRTEDSKGMLEIGSVDILPFQSVAAKQGKQAKKYRLVVKRRPRANGQIDLLTQDAFEYNAILTNNLTDTPVQIAYFYNRRGNMERQFDIMKNDFGWNRMPFSSLRENTVFLYMSAVCRNLYKHIVAHFSLRVKAIKPGSRTKKFLFRFIVLPAKWIRRGGQDVLRVFDPDFSLC